MPTAIETFKSIRHGRLISAGSELHAADPVVVSHPSKFSGVAVEEDKPNPTRKRAAKKAAARKG